MTPPYYQPFTEHITCNDNVRCMRKNKHINFRQNCILCENLISIDYQAMKLICKNQPLPKQEDIWNND